MDIEYRLNQLERKLNNLVRIGQVSSVNSKNCTVKVVFDELDDNFVSHDLPVVVKQTMHNKDFYLPEVNEQVVCIFLPTGLESGFVLGSLYSEEDKPIELEAHIRNITFNDETSFTYDNKKHELSIKVTNDNGKVTINAKNIAIETKKANIVAQELAIKADKATITANTKIVGDLDIEGNIKTSGTISDSKGAMTEMRSIYNSHSHANNGASPPSTPM